jgi:hypothetical protein
MCLSIGGQRSICPDQDVPDCVVGTGAGTDEVELPEDELPEDALLLVDDWLEDDEAAAA